MPTENRSSNTEMVSVPRALAERISNICMFTMCKEDWRALSEILAQPAQHQDEPVGEVVAFGKGLHEIAWAAGRMPRLGAKLYTHPAPADPGEVERLSQVIRDLNDERDEIGAEVGRLRAKLVERDALLGDLKGKTILSWADKHRIDAALSASAESSAAVEIDERASFEYHHRVCDLVRDEDCPEDYRNQSVQDSWEGWQARAALERNPS